MMEEQMEEHMKQAAQQLQQAVLLLGAARGVAGTQASYEDIAPYTQLQRC